MSKLPKIRDIKVPINILEDPLEAKMIPISVKAQGAIETEVETLKDDLKRKRDYRITDFRERLTLEGHTDEELKDTYLIGKITWKLAQIGKENTPEEMASQKKKYSKKILGDLTIEQIIDEIAKQSVDMLERKDLLDRTIAATLYEILRIPDDLRKKVFESVDQLTDEIEETDMYELFKAFSKVQDVKEDEIKN